MKEEFECGKIRPMEPTITLRDQFAMIAMQGHCASDVTILWQTQDHQDVARLAYLLADAMMEARKVKNNAESETA